MAVLYEKTGHIVKLTLDRPEALNAFNRAMHQELNAGFLRFREDPEAWTAIVTGAGNKAFSVGADVKELAQVLADPESIPNLWDSYFHVDLQAGLEVYKPVICAVNGYCLGEGLTLALAADLRLAAQSAVFGYPEVALGMPTIVGGIRATQIMGLGHALELLLLGEQRDAAWAERAGLVNEVVPDDELQNRAWAWAERLCRVGPIAVRCTKEATLRSQRLSFNDAVRMGEAMRRAAFQTEDAREGLKAFLEKRPPRYRGR
ncbi:MAG: enoyl-CoA hydratase-related protein [Thermodesulfobacteriota bacterium]